MKDPLINGPILVNVETLLRGDMSDQDKEMLVDYVYRAYAQGCYDTVKRFESQLFSAKFDSPDPFSGWPVDQGGVNKNWVKMADEFDPDPQIINKEE